MIDKLASKEVQQFLRENEHVDPFQLSLQKKQLFGLPADLIANQLISRQKAKLKLPEWYRTEGIVFPPPISLEQCSSEVTANNKAAIVSGDVLIDLTGGAGVDTYYLSKIFVKVIYVEKSSALCEIAEHNFNLLGANNIQVVNSLSEEFINTYKLNASLIFIDPARRDEHKNKVYKWSDCQPNLPEIQEQLFKIAPKVLSKASPMLDISAALTELSQVTQVHIVSVKNECKEVLYLQEQADDVDSPKVFTKDFHLKDDHCFDLTFEEERKAQAKFSEPLSFLYEPNTSVLKAGAFNTLCERFELSKLHPQTHLYTSNEFIEEFPGRKFSIKGVSALNKKELLKWLPNKKANITVRNFPQDVAAIRKKIGVKPGGEIYLFGVTLNDNSKAILICEKVIQML